VSRTIFKAIFSLRGVTQKMVAASPARPGKDKERKGVEAKISPFSMAQLCVNIKLATG
jgi:hypothetical protein